MAAARRRARLGRGRVEPGLRHRVRGLAGVLARVLVEVDEPFDQVGARFLQADENVRELFLRRGSHTGMKALKLLPLPLLVVGALALSACGSEEADEPATPQQPSIAGIGAGPGISIDEAIALESSEPVLVNGWVYARAGEVRFCDAIAESYPPQCPGVSLLVEGLTLEEVDGLQRASGVAWSGRTKLLGVVADGKITVGENVAA